MNKGTTLEAIGLGVQFTTRAGVVQAAKEVSFCLQAGQTLGIVGESGSGKSVTALSIMRLLPRIGCQITGQIWLKPEAEAAVPLALHELSERAMQRVRGRHIGMVFQEPMSSLNPVFRCGEQVAEAIRLHLRKSRAEARALTLEWFERVQLPQQERMYRAFPHELSGGQKQRVMIAMAMCCQPALLIADEPTTALDVTVQKTVLALIRELQTQTGASCLFISHDLGVISEVAHQVVVMRQGQVVEYGPVQQILQSPQHPYTKGLLACRPPLKHRLRRLPVMDDFEKGKPPAEVKAFTQQEETAQAQALMAQNPLLEVRSLSVQYPGRPPVQAVSEASFELYPGETLGLVGESGSGKTTLGRAILQLIKARQGSVKYRGIELQELTAQAMRPLRRELQMIFQDPYAALNPRLRIGQAIAEPMLYHGLATSSNVTSKVSELLEQVGLTAEHALRYPAELSGGQRQRACIARALAVEPALLICDESVSALDVSVQAQVLNLLQDLRQARGLSMIFISHDLSVIRQISNRLLVMQQGKIVETGITAEVCAQPRAEYTRLLLEAAPGQ